MIEAWAFMQKWAIGGKELANWEMISPRRRRDEDPSYRFAFTDDEVEKEFAGGTTSLDPYTRDWLSFYDREEIENRRKQWEEEKKRSREQSDELCPFATDKRQKKCCLGRLGAD